MVTKKRKKRKSQSKITLLTRFFLISSCLFLFIYLAFANIKIFFQKYEYANNLKQLEQTSIALEEERQKLNVELGSTGSDEYLEKVARESFGYKKDGEQVVVVKKESNNQSNETKQAGVWQVLENTINWIKEKLNP